MPDEPIVFIKSPNTLVGPNDDVLLPRGSTKTDWEVELAIVIGRRGAVGEATVLRLGLEAAQRAARGEPFGAELTEGVWRVLDADAGVGLTTWVHGTGGVDSVTVEVAGTPALSESSLAAACAVVPRHPSFGRGLLTQPTHRVSDLVAMEEFWDAEAFAVMHGFCNGRYPAAVTLVSTPTSTVFLGLHRSRRDFTDEDMFQLGLLREPLAKALEFRLALDAAAERLRGELPAPQTFTAKEAEVLVPRPGSRGSSRCAASTRSRRERVVFLPVRDFDPGGQRVESLRREDDVDRVARDRDESCVWRRMARGCPRAGRP